MRAVGLLLVGAVSAFDVTPRAAGYESDPSRHLLEKSAADFKNCEECVIGSSTWIMTHEFAAIDKWCGANDKCEDEMKCKKKEYFCWAWQKDREVMEGLLIEFTRPLSLGYAWCNGKGTCAKHEDGSIPSVAEQLHLSNPEHAAVLPMMESGVHPSISQGLDDNVLLQNFDEDLMELEDAEGWNHHHHHDHEGFFARIAHFFKHIFHKEDEMPEWVDPEEGLTEEEKKVADPSVNGVCVRCYKKVFTWIMHHVTKEAKKICANPPCPFMAGWCKWAGAHPAMAYGMLMGHAEPWKYAIGRCWHPKGKGKGHHHKGKGKGHDGKGKGKGDDKGKGKGKGDDVVPQEKGLLKKSQDEPVVKENYV